MKEISKAKKYSSKPRVSILLTALTVLALCLSFFACQKPPTQAAPPPPTQDFDATEFYRANTVEIVSVGDFGQLKTGTGLIISGDGAPIIVSNFHVAGAVASSITVRFFGEESFVNTNTIVSDNIIEVLEFDQSKDLCIFKVDYQPTTLYNKLTVPLESGIIPLSASEPTVGQAVLSLGNAGGSGIKQLSGKITALASEVQTLLGTLTLIQTSLPITEGCSGGAMFDQSGKLIGITSFSHPSDEGGYAIPVSDIIQLYQKASAHKL